MVGRASRYRYPRSIPTEDDGDKPASRITRWETIVPLNALGATMFSIDLMADPSQVLV